MNLRVYNLHGDAATKYPVKSYYLVRF